MPVTPRILSDNPEDVDLLGFEPLVDAVGHAVQELQDEPLTVGVNAPWGGGKTTVLRLLERHLSEEVSGFHVVNVTPWEFDPDLDPRGELVRVVLASLRRRSEEGGEAFGEVADKIRTLTEQVDWLRATVLVGKGLATGSIDVPGILKAVLPSETDDAEEAEPSLEEFRRELRETLEKLEIERLVVLVDDLDRCLPQAVTATFEAIKLFLSVPRVAFVIAADAQMVQQAVASSLEQTSRRHDFARRYHQKIVQVPVTVPGLTRPDAEAYVAQLMLRDQCDASQFRNLRTHVAACRSRGESDYLGGFDGQPQITSDMRVFAAQVVGGMTDAAARNPREIKRLLNGFALRWHIAQARNVQLSVPAMAKLFVLEDQHPQSFAYLAEQTSAGQARTLSTWEEWGKDESLRGQPPEGADEGLYEWAATKPFLSEIADLDRYLNLAKSLHERAVSGALDRDEWIDGLVRTLLRNSGSTHVVQRNLDRLLEAPAEQQDLFVKRLVATARENEDEDERGDVMNVLVELANRAEHESDLEGATAEAVGELLDRVGLDAIAHAASSSSPEVTRAVHEAMDDGRIEPQHHDTIRTMLTRREK